MFWNVGSKWCGVCCARCFSSCVTNQQHFFMVYAYIERDPPSDSMLYDMYCDSLHGVEGWSRGSCRNSFRTIEQQSWLNAHCVERKCKLRGCIAQLIHGTRSAATDPVLVTDCDVVMKMHCVFRRDVRRSASSSGNHWTPSWSLRNKHIERSIVT